MRGPPAPEPLMLKTSQNRSVRDTPRDPACIEQTNQATMKALSTRSDDGESSVPPECLP